MRNFTGEAERNRQNHEGQNGKLQTSEKIEDPKIKLKEIAASGPEEESFRWSLGIDLANLRIEAILRRWDAVTAW